MVPRHPGMLNKSPVPPDARPKPTVRALRRENRLFYGRLEGGGIEKFDLRAQLEIAYLTTNK